MYKAEYDSEAKSLYVYIKYPIGDGEVKSSRQIADNEWVVGDYSETGELLGIEIVGVEEWTATS
jgi:uncharacterized protein YuzE